MMKKGLIMAVVCMTVSGILVACGGKGIGEEEAKQIAFEDAGAKESGTSRIWTSTDREDGRVVYEISFMVKESGIEYEYEVEGSDGSIVKTESEDIKAFFEEIKQKQGSGQDTGNINVFIEEAVQIALEGVNKAGEDAIKIKLENDDGRYQYEGDIIYEHKKYEFEIDANDGSVLSWGEESM